MACFKQKMYVWGAYGGIVAGAAAVAAGVTAEVGTAGAATPAAIATVIGGLAAMVASLTVEIAAAIDLEECYAANGHQDDAAKIGVHVTAQQAEMARIDVLLDRLRVLVP
jgi:hypothetical protein